IRETLLTMFEWIDDQGLRTLSYSREVYLECPEDLAGWITEIQIPVAGDEALGEAPFEGWSAL
ncbi:MAG: hypothetical protein ACC660_08705, partial [Acidimicrobiales bacterium]